METTRSFTEFNLHPDLLNALTSMGFEKASPVQDMTIPVILEGKDLFAQAETGSGKTGSFAIPIIQQILTDGSQDDVSAEDHIVHYIVLSPTRELAQQTDTVFSAMASKLGIHAVCLIGGESIERQKELLRGKISILVATPGRLCDLIRQRSVSVDQCKAVVFDEADRLFDMGFKKEIEFILNHVPRTRQLIMVSATSNMDVLETAYKFHSQPVELKLNSESILVDNIDHSIGMISSNEKMPLLVQILREHVDTYALIFCNTQIETHRVAEWLSQMGFKSQAISGRLPQNKRTRLMEQFRAKEVTILVCTDVAARGLDIKDVNLVINYDLPQEAASYVHRIGRTGRAGKLGKAISFCAHEDAEYLDPIIKYIDSKIPKMDLTDESFAKDIPPRPYLDHKTLKVVERNAPRNSDRPDRKERQRPERKERGERPMQDDGPAPVFEPLEKRELPPYFATEDLTGDRRYFVLTLSSTEAANSGDFRAMGYFQIEDKELLERQVLKMGAKKFWLFGPREITYRYNLKPQFDRVLSPFIKDILKTMRVRLSVTLTLKGQQLELLFKGPDESMLTRNNNELLEALETLSRLYLARKVPLRGELQILFKTSRPARKEEARSNDRRPRTQGQEPRGRRPRGEDPKREENLLKMVEKMKQQVLSSKEAVVLKPMDSRERRLVHQYLSDDHKVKTTSLGDGRLKKIEISLKNNENESANLH
jgi:ATP-dependent RNA helicase RhlE